MEAYRVNGTPADCVALGTHIAGADIGSSALRHQYGFEPWQWHVALGYLAAAKQAALLGLRGIALSTIAGKTEPDFDALGPYVERTLSRLLEMKDAKLLNVNFPPVPKGIEMDQAIRFDSTMAK